MCRLRQLLLLVALACGMAVCAEAQPAPVNASDVLLPLPRSIAPLGGSYVPPPRLAIVPPAPADKETRQIAADAADILGKAWGRPADVTADPAASGAIRLALTPGNENPESYRLVVAPAGVELSAPTTTGLFYGLQTLRQLAEQRDPAGIAAVRIDDAPRFPWRGLHLDVARHMMPVAYIKQQLDLMARYKFNRFHWHLTDDQSWRLEIKRYPRLTSIGAWRDQTMIDQRLPPPWKADGQRYGGFYTQAEVREVVAYAAARHIEVIPEIDIPGHTVSVLAGYPELACTPGPFKVRTAWGVADDILCPSDASLEFIENVMLEVMDLFPSRYIHLGGDEAPTARWKQSPLAQSIIKREGLKDELALQGWFLRRVEEFLQAHGRHIIGWERFSMASRSPARRSCRGAAWTGASPQRRAVTT